jgi:hydroxyethylthiazole kinase-like uncharacterized protein yjeF
MQSVSPERMREIDRRCIDGVGIPGVVLMNNAGAAVFHQVERGPVAVVCGKGNNGGDGYVVARLALAAGFETTVILLANPEEIGGDAGVFLRAYRRMGGTLLLAQTPDEVREVLEQVNALTWIDARLGTGARGPVREPYATAIQHWPQAHTIAVDVPSGLDAGTGQPGAPCLRADLTVTLHAAKQGFANPEAAPYLGTLLVVDIGIPPICGDDAAWAALGLEPKS